MKTLLIALVVSLTTLCTSCLSPAQKTEAKQLAVQIGSQVAKNAAIAAATTAVKLAQVALTDTNTKLAAQRAALDANPNASAKDEVKLAALETAAAEAQDLLTAAQKQLDKLKGVDTAPTPLPPVVVTPASK